jgi:hypothetical protein
MRLQFQFVCDQNVGYLIFALNASFILISMALALLHPALALMLLALLTPPGDSYRQRLPSFSAVMLMNSGTQGNWSW